MDFLKFLDKKAEERNWLNFFLSLVEFLLNEEKLKWNLNSDGCFSDSFKSFLPKKFFPKEDINGEPKIIISIIEDNDIQCTISIEYREDFNLMVIFCLCLTEEIKTEFHGFYKQETIETVVEGEENTLVISKLKDLHNKLIHFNV